MYVQAYTHTHTQMLIFMVSSHKVLYKCIYAHIYVYTHTYMYTYIYVKTGVDLYNTVVTASDVAVGSTDTYICTYIYTHKYMPT